MALVDMRDMLHHAHENNYAVGAFDLVSLDFLEAVIDAAENCRAGVILSVAEPHFAHYDLELMLPAVEAAAKRASIPVAIQLDHGRSLDAAVRAIQLGCNSVMIDASNLDLPQNIEATQKVVAMAHSCGIPVVGELGYVAGREGEGAQLHPGQSALTIPSEAKVYVERTGVDCLAISIGTVQGRLKGRAKLDFSRLRQIHQTVSLPLEIHGGSGLNEAQYRKLAALGVAKINYYTALADIAADVMRKQSKENPQGTFTDLKKGVKDAIGNEVQRCVRLWGSAGRAAEVLAQCAPWEPVDHVMMLHRKSDPGQSHRMLEGYKNALLTIPGVRTVSAGQALDKDDRFQLLLQIRLAHPDCLRQLEANSDYQELCRRFCDSIDTESAIGTFTA